MRLAKLSVFRKSVYAPGSEPKLSTLRARIRAGQIPGGTVEHGRYFVDLDEYDRVKGLRSAIEARRAARAESPLLKGLL